MSSLPSAADEWRPILQDMKSAARVKAVKALFKKAMLPTCEAMAAEVAELEAAGDLTSWREARSIQMIAHQSFALTIGALWEREFQDHLLASAAIIRPDEYEELERLILRGRWEGFAEAFEKIRGFPLSAVPTQQELKRLHMICSAVRHGTGRSADQLYKLDSSLFLPEALIVGYFDYFVESVNKASVSRLDLSIEQLKGFRDAVASFWELIDHLRTTTRWKP